MNPDAALPALHRVALADAAALPWRNGGGLTRTLLAWPEAAGEHWTLRVSVADISADGPFSAWPGVWRGFAVLDGAGVRLTLPTGALTLGPRSPALAFDGADAPACSLLDGPTRDLNLMARQGCGQAGLRRVAGPHDTLPAAPGWRAVYCHGAARLRRGCQAAEALAAGTLAWQDDDASLWQLSGDGAAPLDAFWLHWSPA